MDWRKDRDAIVGLLVLIAQRLGAELDIHDFVTVAESAAGPGLLSPEEAVALARQIMGG